MTAPRHGDDLDTVPAIGTEVVSPALAALAVAVLSCGCGGKGPSSDVPGLLFREVTIPAAATNAPWPDGRYRLPEITAAGVALFDADGDGDLDILLVCHPPPDAPESPAPDRLFAQTAPLVFEEVPGARGLADPGYGNGVAAGDIDGDGDLDVYIGNLGPDRLYRNRGDGTWEDATAASGIREDGWTSGAAFLDHDRDGDLDLWVVHYVIDDPSRACVPGAGEPRDYCGPWRYQSVADVLYENDGAGRFRDISREAGIGVARSGLAIACADLTGDGWVDVYVANDGQPNQLWVKQRDGTFRDEAPARGLALSGSGQAEASMGIALGDIDGDTRFDILVTSLAGETATLYASGAGGVYEERSAAAGIGGPTLSRTTWGCGIVDLDNDGDLDAVLTNGRIARGAVDPRAEVGPFWSPYAEPNQVFLDRGGGKLEDASARGGGFTAHVESTRALALGDLDRDGDVDLVASDLANRLRVFENIAAPPAHHWLRVRALTGNRDALGAVVEVRAGATTQRRVLISTYSYAAVNETAAHFGLGTAARADDVVVTWPNGARESFGAQAANREVVLRQGAGRARLPPSR